MINALYVVASVLKARTKSERGATAVEYGLLVALIAAIIVAAVALLGQNILGGFDEVNAEIGGAGAEGGGEG